MKETEEKSSLNDYHRERNKKAVLAVEEMKNRPCSLEEMTEQTTRILSTVSPEERGIVLEICGEGGGIRKFDAIENKWKKRMEGIDQLTKEAIEFQIDENSKSYLIAYPHFIDYFANIQTNKIGIDNLVVGIHFVYGWMPRIFKFKTNKIEDAIPILNKVKLGEYLVRAEYGLLISLLDNSLVGTSKLLHFINPEKYAIWDSRVHNYLSKNIKSLNISSNIKEISNYENYLKYLSEVTSSVEFSEIYSLVNEKIENKFKYKISSFRAIELLMFINGKK